MKAPQTCQGLFVALSRRPPVAGSNERTCAVLDQPGRAINRENDALRFGRHTEAQGISSLLDQWQMWVTS